MKKIIFLFIVLPFLGLGQVQIDQDIDGEARYDRFGNSLSISAGGTIIAIGDPDTNITQIYRNVEGNCIQLGSDINGKTLGDRFGNSVSLFSNGEIVAIGAPFNSTDPYINSAGHVRVFDISTEVLSTSTIELIDFSIYPNPSRNQFTIQLEPSVQLKNVTIYNTLGQVVLTSDTSTTLSTRENTINTSKLSSGSYIVEITTSKVKSSKKLIIK